jgi:branched-chain amino acid transport system ATP-binding protein
VTLLSVQSLDARHGLLAAVRDVTLDVEDGETLALVGANGAGKTTLLRTIAGGHRPTGGRIVFDGRDVTRSSAHDHVRMGIALVPEGRRLFPGLTVEENLLVAAGRRRRHGRWTLDTVYEAFPILRARRKQRALTLSGGEQQATAIARALMSNPRLLLLDEVSLGLAPTVVEGVYRSLETVVAEGTTILLVEQDLGRAMAFADQVVCMLEGRIVLAGPPATLTREEVTDAYFGLRGGSRR